ncbi:MAG: SDR family NAD(P)-dependent oxidoreductase [Rhodopila sp.]
MANRIDLEGKVAVVTGGAQGIGYAIAQRLQDSGAKLILWDREESLLEEARRTLGPEGEAVEIVTFARRRGARQTRRRWETAG